MKYVPHVIRMEIEYIAWFPHDWDTQMIEFHRNDGSWCSDNVVGEFETMHDYIGSSNPEKYDEDGNQRVSVCCTCWHTKFKHLRPASEDDIRAYPVSFMGAPKAFVEKAGYVPDAES